jgi:phosphomannomutase/phosphoglucomutase
VVDNNGDEIFADKIGVMLARDLSKLYPNATFVVDVKSTGLFATDPVLIANGVKADYWKTGHSYIKRRVTDLKALAGFEKSGHFFFNAPVGRGYDDGLVTAIHVIDMLDRNPASRWPTSTPSCRRPGARRPCRRIAPTRSSTASSTRSSKRFQDMEARGETIHRSEDHRLVTVNGVRVTVEDGTWGLVRASSNKPELVVVVESPASEARMREMFAAVDKVLRENPDVGAYNQTI